MKTWAVWRAGSKVPVNIYKDDKIVGQCQTPEYAAEIVATMNAVAALLRAQAGPVKPDEAQGITS